MQLPSSVNMLCGACMQLQNTIRSHREEAQHKYCVCAFVTFKTEEARLKCMQANPSSIGVSHLMLLTLAYSSHTAACLVTFTMS